MCCVLIGNDNMTCSGVAVPYHTLHNTPHSPLLPTTTPHTANHTPHTDNGKPLSSRNIPLNPSPSNLRPHTLHIRPRTSDRGRAQAQGRRAQSPVGPRLPPFLSDNCCCQCFFCCCHDFVCCCHWCFKRLYQFFSCKYCTKHATVELLRLTKLRHTRGHTHGVAMLNKKHDIDNFMFGCSP